MAIETHNLLHQVTIDGREAEVGAAQVERAFDQVAAAADKAAETLDSAAARQDGALTQLGTTAEGVGVKLSKMPGQALSAWDKLRAGTDDTARSMQGFEKSLRQVDGFTRNFDAAAEQAIRTISDIGTKFGLGASESQLFAEAVRKSAAETAALSERYRTGAVSAEAHTRALIEQRQGLEQQWRALQQSSRAVAENAKAMADQGSVVDQAARTFNGLRNRLDPLAGAYRKLNAEAEALDTLLTAGKLTGEEYTAWMERLSAEIDRVTASNAKAMADQGSVADQAARTFDGLRNRLDPLAGAYQKLNAEAEALDTLLTAGKLTGEEHTAWMERLSAEIDRVTASTRQLSNAEREIAAERTRQHAETAQLNYNNLLRIKDPAEIKGSAAVSASVFMEVGREAEAEAKALANARDEITRISASLELAGAAEAKFAAQLDHVREILIKTNASEAEATRLIEAYTAARDPQIVHERKEAEALQTLVDRLDPAGAALRRVADDQAALNAARAADKIDPATHARLSQALDEQAAAYQRNGHSASFAFRNQEILRSGAINTIQSLAAGQSAMEVLIVQGTQTAPVLLDVAGKALALAVPILAVGAALAVVGARAAEAAAETRALSVTLKAMAAAPGLTAEGLHETVIASARVGGSRAEALQGVQSLIRSGRFAAGEQMHDLMTLAPDFAAAYGSEIPAAVDKLGQAFGAGAAGVLKLDEELHFLKRSQIETLEGMRAANDAVGAFGVGMAALSGRVRDAAKNSRSEWSQALHEMRNAWDEFLDRVSGARIVREAGQTAAWVAKGVRWALSPDDYGGINEQIARKYDEVTEAQARFDRARAGGPSWEFGLFGASKGEIADMEAGVRRLLAELNALPGNARHSTGAPGPALNAAGYYPGEEAAIEKAASAFERETEALRGNAVERQIALAALQAEMAAEEKGASANAKAAAADQARARVRRDLTIAANDNARAAEVEIAGTHALALAYGGSAEAIREATLARQTDVEVARGSIESRDAIIDRLHRQSAAERELTLAQDSRNRRNQTDLYRYEEGIDRRVAGDLQQAREKAGGALSYREQRRITGEIHDLAGGEAQDRVTALDREIEAQDRLNAARLTGNPYLIAAVNAENAYWKELKASGDETAAASIRTRTYTKEIADLVTEAANNNRLVAVEAAGRHSVAAAYGVSSAAVREASIVAEAWSEQARGSIEPLGTIIARLHQQAAATRALTQAQHDAELRDQIADTLRLAEAWGRGAAAAREAALANQILAQVRKEGAENEPGRVQAIAVQTLILDAAQRRQQLLEAAAAQRDEAEAALVEYRLLGQSNAARAEAVAIHRTQLEMQRAGTALTDQEKQTIIGQAGALARMRAEIADQTQTAGDIANAIGGGLEKALTDSATQYQSFWDRARSITESAMADIQKIMVRAWVTKPFETWLTGQLAPAVSAPVPAANDDRRGPRWDNVMRLVEGGLSAPVPVTVTNLPAGGSLVPDFSGWFANDNGPGSGPRLSGGRPVLAFEGRAALDTRSLADNLSRSFTAQPMPVAIRDGGAIADLVARTADSYGVPREVALTVARLESDFRQFNADGSLVRSRAGAQGVMQLMPATAAELGVDATDITQNVTGGIRFLASLGRRFGAGSDPASWAMAAAAYNAGPGRVAQYLGDERPLPAETVTYLERFGAAIGDARSHTDALAQTMAATRRADDAELQAKLDATAAMARGVATARELTAAQRETIRSALAFGDTMDAEGATIGRELRQTASASAQGLAQVAKASTMAAQGALAQGQAGHLAAEAAVQAASGTQQFLGSLGSLFGAVSGNRTMALGGAVVAAGGPQGILSSIGQLGKASGVSGLLGGGGGGWFQGVGDFLDSPITPGSEIARPSTDFVGPMASDNAGLLGSTTWGQGLGGALNVGSGIFQMTRGGTGNMISGAANIAAGIMAFTPAAPFAPLVSIAGSLIGGLFGPKPSVGPEASASLTSFEGGGHFRFNAAGSDNGGDSSQLEQQVRAAVKQLNGVVDAYSLKISDYWGGISSGKDSGGFASIDEMVADMVRNAVLSGSGLVGKVLTSKTGGETLQDLGTNLAFAQKLDDGSAALDKFALGIKGVQAAAEAALDAPEKLRAIAAEFQKAKDLGLGDDYTRITTVGYTNTLKAALETTVSGDVARQVATMRGTIDGYRQAAGLAGGTIDEAAIQSALESWIGNLRTQTVTALQGQLSPVGAARASLSGIEQQRLANRANLEAVGGDVGLADQVAGGAIRALLVGLDQAVRDQVANDAGGTVATIAGTLVRGVSSYAIRQQQAYAATLSAESTYGRATSGAALAANRLADDLQRQTQQAADLNAATDDATRALIRQVQAQDNVAVAAKRMAEDLDWVKQRSQTFASTNASTASLLGDTLAANKIQIGLQYSGQLDTYNKNGWDTAQLTANYNSAIARAEFDQSMADLSLSYDRQIRAVNDNIQAIQGNSGALLSVRLALHEAAQNLRITAPSNTPLQAFTEAESQFDQLVVKFNAAVNDNTKQRYGQQLQSVGQSLVQAEYRYTGGTDQTEKDKVLTVWDSIGNTSRDQVDLLQEQIDQGQQTIELLTRQKEQALRIGERQVGSIEDNTAKATAAFGALNASMGALSAYLPNLLSAALPSRSNSQLGDLARMIADNPIYSQGIASGGRNAADQVSADSLLTVGENQALARALGYSGEFGAGQHLAWLQANPNRAAEFQQASEYAQAIKLADSPSRVLGTHLDAGTGVLDDPFYDSNFGIGDTGLTVSQQRGIGWLLGYRGTYGTGEFRNWWSTNTSIRSEYADLMKYMSGYVVGTHAGGGVVGNGLWGVDSVIARHAGGGVVGLAGGEGILTAATTAFLGGPPAIDALNRLPYRPANDWSGAPADGWAPALRALPAATDEAEFVELRRQNTLLAEQNRMLARAVELLHGLLVSNADGLRALETAAETGNDLLAELVGAIRHEQARPRRAG